MININNNIYIYKLPYIYNFTLFISVQQNKGINNKQEIMNFKLKNIC